MARGRPGHLSSRDDNHGEISKAFEMCGAPVIDLSMVGHGVPDIIVSYKGMYHLVEIKNPGNHYGKRGFNKRQKKWAEEWRGGPVHIARTIADVKELITRWDRECARLSRLEAEDQDR